MVSLVYILILELVANDDSEARFPLSFALTISSRFVSVTGGLLFSDEYATQP